MYNKLLNFCILICLLIIGCRQTDNNIKKQYQNSFEILVTNNSREFERIPQLQLENWV